jgi:U2 small nuclear ribonucleoprotein B''
MPAAAAGAVTATELQQSIFNAPPSAAASANTTAQVSGTLKPPTDHAMEDARSPTTSVAGQKRPREEEEEEDEADEDSEGDVAMDEDSD